MSKKISDVEYKNISAEVINAINQYTDEDMDPTSLGFDPMKIFLTKNLGIGPTLIGQLSVPLTKISNRHGGRGVGVISASEAQTVDDELKLVIASIEEKK
ncbi:MAG: hypothetical protein M3Y65_15145 [Pseudomonadota bacterium]|nr:hypothetical protein [Pseudomonadota bacterium]